MDFNRILHDTHTACNVHSDKLDKQEFRAETVMDTRISKSRPPTNHAFVKASAVYFVPFSK